MYPPPSIRVRIYFVLEQANNESLLKNIVQQFRVDTVPNKKRVKEIDGMCTLLFNFYRNHGMTFCSLYFIPAIIFGPSFNNIGCNFCVAVLVKFIVSPSLRISFKAITPNLSSINSISVRSTFPLFSNAKV